MEERVLHAFFGGGGGEEEEEAFDLAGKTLVEWADEPEYNEEMCRLARWQVCVCVCVCVCVWVCVRVRLRVAAGV